MKNKDKKLITILDLGSSFAKQTGWIKKCSNQIIYIEIDALSNSPIVNTNLKKHIRIQKAIHTESGIFPFYERNYLGTSSFLKYKENIPRTYNIEWHCNTKETHQFQTVSIVEVLNENKVESIDFMKLDLEGLDFKVLESLESYFKDLSVIQIETRFQPIYESEPDFIEISSYMRAKGFELINIANLNEWKLNTRNQKKLRDGRLVWGDFIFYNVNEKKSRDIYIIQTYVSKFIGLNSYSEYLYENFLINNETSLIDKELESMIYDIPIKDRFFRYFFNIIAKTKLIYPIRKILYYLYKQSCADKNLPQLT